MVTSTRKVKKARKQQEEEEGNAILDMEQTRTDLEFGLENPFGVFTSLNVRLGINDYEHKELEPSGAAGSVFENDAWELRTELVYELDNWTGAFGVQHTDREFSAIGEEAFVPPVDSQDTGVFWVFERPLGDIDLEAGVRLGRVEHSPQSGSDVDFTTYAASLGFVVPLSPGLELGIVADLSSRAPVAEELFSDGPHLVTNAFEIGDPDLDSERAANLSATLRYTGENWRAAVTAYATRFSDFIYEAATGGEEDDLPIFQFQQDDARFLGLDAEVSATVARWDGGTLSVRGLLDVVDAELDIRGNDNVPRIPPLRYGAGLELNLGRISASLDYLRVTKQDDVAPQELETDAYNDLRAYLGADVPLGDGTLQLFLSGRNLTDDEQRRHTSFIKDFAPAPGRSVEAGLRVLF